MSTVRSLTIELIEMSRNCEVPIFDENRAVYLHDDNKPRAAEIGRKLDELGGMEAMMLAI